MKRLRAPAHWAAWLLAATLLAGPAPAVADAGSVYLEDLTWTELRDRIAGGATTAIVPIGGTEQNGPHMTLGKHNVRARLLAGRIAQRLGQAVVAPVVAYVPEGPIEPPAQHMRYAGTISVPEAAFESVLEATVRSLQRHGLRDVVLLGDHGGYQASLMRVAGRLAGRGAGRVLVVPDYYRAATADHARWLAGRGFGAAVIGSHAGLADTSLMLALDATQVRVQALAGAQGEGAVGDPRQASAELGQAAVEHIVAATVQAIRQRIGQGGANPGRSQGGR